LNVREDAYGGSAENRARIVIEILEAVTRDWGPRRVGIKISPTLEMGGFTPTAQNVETYDHLMDRLNELPLSHLQVVKAPNDLAGTPIAELQDTIGHFRDRYRGVLIANFGFDKASANSVIESGQADAVSFGKLFISNPDLVRRLHEDLPLSAPVQETFYQGGSQGYVDYPPAA
jgi:N-ethylmaleimide reductase